MAKTRIKKDILCNAFNFDEVTIELDRLLKEFEYLKKNLK
jgi:hypothetical protein